MTNVTPPIVCSSGGDYYPESSDCKSVYNMYLPIERGRPLDFSESNIYTFPDEPATELKKQKRYKTVHHANDKGFDYQEVNSDGKSIGEMLSHIPKDSETFSGRLSKRSGDKETPADQQTVTLALYDQASNKQINLKASLVVITEE